MTENTITTALAIFIGAVFTMLAVEGCSKEPDNKPAYQENVNCAHKRDGSRPACWTQNDWTAYCSNTGNCRR